MMKKGNFLFRRDDFCRNGGRVIEDFYVNLTGGGNWKACFHLNLYLDSEWRDFSVETPPQPESTVFIGMIISGMQCRKGESGTRILEPGDVYIDRVRDEKIFNRSLPGEPLRRIGLEIFRNSHFETFCCTLFPEPVTVIKCGEAEKIKNILRAMKEEINLHGGREKEISTLIFLLLQELSAQYVRYGLPEPLRKASEVIEKNGFQMLSREKLAAECGVSVRKLTSLFQQYLKTSPGRYMLQRRIDYAAGLLKTGRFSVKETARLAGFSSAEFFIRVFKRSAGVTPGKF